MLNAVRAWILLSALLVSSGWILSAGHALNRAGYLAAFALAGIALVVWRQKNKSPAPIFFCGLDINSSIASNAPHRCFSWCWCC